MPRSITDILTQKRRGIEYAMPRAEYDAVSQLNPSSITQGLLDHIDVDASRIKYAFENPNARKVTPEAQARMDRGILCHMFLLQQDRIAEDVVKWSGKGGEGYEAFKIKNPTKLVIKAEDYAQTASAALKFRNEPQVRALLDGIKPEVAVFSQEGNLFTKGLIDGIGTAYGQKVIVDIKTTEAGLTQRKVEQTIRDFHYREKLTAYKRWYERESGEEIFKVWMLFLSMQPPHYGIRRVYMTTEALTWGGERLDAALKATRKGIEDSEWPMFCADDQAKIATFEVDTEITC